MGVSGFKFALTDLKDVSFLMKRFVDAMDLLVASKLFRNRLALYTLTTFFLSLRRWNFVPPKGRGSCFCFFNEIYGVARSIKDGFKTAGVAVFRGTEERRALDIVGERQGNGIGPSRIFKGLVWEKG